jgi:basic membrane lipoprotein Med (substrate-binding protein (PBP1-ABC) superfamily)
MKHTNGSESQMSNNVKALLGVLGGAIIGIFLAFMTFPHVEPHLNEFFGIKQEQKVVKCEKVWPNTFEHKVKRTE